MLFGNLGGSEVQVMVHHLQCGVPQYLQKGDRQPSAKTLKAIEAALVRMLDDSTG